MRAGFRPREPRIRVHVPARMRSGDTWTDITILNVSSRGLMARTNAVPPARSYVEIRRGTEITIVGKVVWQDAAHFGIRAQDRVGIALLTGTAVSHPQHDAITDRRARTRADRLDPAEAFDRSRRKAALFQFAILTLGGFAGAILIGSTVMTILHHPFKIIADHLG